MNFAELSGILKITLRKYAVYRACFGTDFTLFKGGTTFLKVVKFLPKCAIRFGYFIKGI
jgi:hypothetical protein